MGVRWSALASVDFASVGGAINSTGSNSTYVVLFFHGVLSW